MPEGPPLSPDDIARRTFATSFRGFDPGEVRSFLSRMAEQMRELDGRIDLLRRQVTEVEERARHPQLDVDTLTTALGDETARILKSAQDAAHDIRAKAEENVAQLLREAYEEAGRIRAEAESVLGRETEAAEAAAADIRAQAERDAAAALGRAREEAERALADVEAQAREVVEEAETRRAKVLSDLARRRRLAHVQVEQLRAGRERLLESYRLVRTTLDEVTDDLRRAEAEAREAAEEAGRRVAEEAGDEVVEDDVAAEAEPAAADSAPTPAEPAAAPTPAEPAAAEAEPAAAESAPAEPEPAEAESAAAESAPPTPVEPPLEERRLSSLRIIRRPKAEPAFVPAAPPVDEYEGVRIIKPEPAEEPPLPEDTEPVATTEPEPPAPAAAEPAAPAPTSPPVARNGDGEPEVTAVHEAKDLAERDVLPHEPESAPAGPGGGGGAVDELFARIRADRAEAVARAHVVLDEQPEPTEPTEPAERPVPDADEALLQRRDAAVEEVEQRLARRLKRSLQDEQNDVLDRLRLHRGKAGADVLLPDLDEHAARYREVAAAVLQEAADAGASFVGGPGAGAGPATALDDLVAGLASDLVAPLRRRLERSLEEGGDEDQALVIERINAAYREIKGRRVEQLASDHVVAAFSRGAVGSAPAGTTFRWVVDDGDGSCPDCDDNALAGPTPAGEAFPTGQVHPPAHTGCRCLLVLAAD